MYFKSKVDKWFIIVIFIAVIVLLIPMIAIQSTASLLYLPLIGFMLWIAFGTGYNVHKDRLIIKSGPFKWTIYFKDIESIISTKNPLSSPALSLNRLEIKFKKSSVLISPLNKEEFLRVMRERCPLAYFRD